MKRKVIACLLLGAMIFQLTGCSFGTKCKEDGCDNTEIYDDGYCKKHYYENVGDNLKEDVAGLFE